MTTSITIPATIEAAKQQLGGIGKLLTAKEWERAAIVYAFTTDEVTGRGNRGTSTALSARAFAELGITGLKSDRTVREYRKAWQEAMKDGAPDVKPGDTFTMPNLPWPPGFIEQRRGSHATTAEVEAGVRKLIEDQPEKVVAELAQNPESFRKATAPGSRSRKVLVEAIAELPSVGDEVTEATAAVREARAMPKPEPELRADRVMRVVTNALNEFWTREVQAGPNRVTFQQVVETAIENRNSPSMRSRMVPTANLGNELLDALAKHIDLSEDIRDGKTLTTGKALVGGGN